jgi:4-diphosphocytidyl-2-C-methyl-D-erythritol kinase
MVLFPNAKINIGLNIINKRPDGFHNIETVMVPIRLTDILTLHRWDGSLETKTRFTATGLKIDGNPEDNLVIKAYQLLDKQFQLPAIDIHLHKTIPFGAGMGGGSADGAFMLKGLNQLFQLHLSDIQLEAFAAQLGSDCPFFIKNIPAIASGRGELLVPVPLDLSAYWLAVVIPPLGISTKEAYARVKPKAPDFRLEKCITDSIHEWKNRIVNDFEPSVYEQKPEIGGVKDKLFALGALYASLSGSGAASYGIFSSEPEISKAFPPSYFKWLSRL